jgi:hypothetical protein
MKALTIKQPWVHAILYEGKLVENRSWNTRHRGWLAIHAAKTPSRNAEFPLGVKKPDLEKLDYSAIVGVAWLSDVKSSVRSKWFYRPKRGERNLAWILTNVAPLKKPIPMKGALSLWDIPSRAVTKIRKQLPGLKLE